MNQIKYKIHRLSARAVMGHAILEDGGFYTFNLNSSATRKCFTASQVEQDDNALFYQLLDELGMAKPTGKQAVDALADVTFFMDFAGVFDKNSTQKKYTDRQKKAESMFRPAGVTLDFGSGPCSYVAFERSASMSRRSMISSTIYTLSAKAPFPIATTG